MRSTLFVVGAIGAVLVQAEEQHSTATVINTNTITVTTCGSGCVGHGSSTAVVSAASTPCETPAGSTLVTSFVPPVGTLLTFPSSTISPESCPYRVAIHGR